MRRVRLQPQSPQHPADSWRTAGVQWVRVKKNAEVNGIRGRGNKAVGKSVETQFVLSRVTRPLLHTHTVFLEWARQQSST